MTLSLKAKAKRSGGEWEISCDETGDTVFADTLEGGLINLVEQVSASLKRDSETPRRIVIGLEDVKASATVAVRFENNRSLDDFDQGAAEEVRTDEDETPLLGSGQQLLTAGDASGELPPGWHPSTNNCQGCVLLGYKRDDGRKTPYHVCSIRDRPPSHIEKCPLGTGPVLKVDCELWGDDTMCYRTIETDCDRARMEMAHCPILYPGALEYLRRHLGRNPDTGRLTTDYCQMKDCKDLQKREMNRSLECTISGKIPGNMMACPKEAT